MTLLARIVRFARGWRATPGHAPAAAAPAELWCRAATVLALRNRAGAPGSHAGGR